MSAYTPDNVLPTPQRRIRHITSFQVRNLTPFPARDALAQTLAQLSPNPLSIYQQPADDADLTWAARRRRRVSVGSVSTVFNTEAENEGGLSATGSQRQKRISSKGSFQGIRNIVSAASPSTIRQRTRASPKTSAVATSPCFASTGGDIPDSARDWTGVPSSGQHSQRGLEKIVTSRLVETFVTLTLPPSPVSGTPANSRPNTPPLSATMAAGGPSRKGEDVSVKRVPSASAVTHRRGTSSSSSASTLSVTSQSLVKRTRSLASPAPNRSSSRHGSKPASASTSSKLTNFPSPPPTPPPLSPPRHSPSPSISGTRPSTISTRKSERECTTQTFVSTPFYISPLHLPSTNPRFSDLDPEREFAPWADLSESHVKVAIWGRDNTSSGVKPVGADTKGKGKAIPYAANLGEAKGCPLWKILEEWDVDLNNMEPLSADDINVQLPSNTLILTVASGEIFRIPPVSSKPLSRAPTPSGPEYNSDGDVNELRYLRREQEESDNRKRELETLEKSRRETRMKRSACWQDLVKIVNLQTCIVDTKESLEEVVRNCNMLIEGGGHSAALREISEREEWVRTLRSEREDLIGNFVGVKDSIEARRWALKLRRENLAGARAMYEQDLHHRVIQAQEVEQERRRHAELVASLSPLRTTLIQAVSFIFPIEPLSAPDLLFTVLGAPLPIPVSASDPAPPLSLPSQPDVTEDNTATALGYVAQIVQLISAYLGKSLVYPVTCCGSRSAIKDPISAMMGPRMFPLYSRGVETYRFEYGVFLLNKDIEMLMTDRDLRAMDMRHTLPNLKNLLLTLTVSEDVEQSRIWSPISVTIPSGLQPPTRAVSPLALESSQSQPHDKEILPRPVIIASRKSTPFLSPLAAILRARYPSSAGQPTVKVVDEMSEPSVDSDTEATSELRNDSFDDVAPPDGESKVIVNANDTALWHPPSNGHEKLLEKLAKSDERSTLPPPLTNAT